MLQVCVAATRGRSRASVNIDPNVDVHSNVLHLCSSMRLLWWVELSITPSDRGRPTGTCPVTSPVRTGALSGRCVSGGGGGAAGPRLFFTLGLFAVAVGDECVVVALVEAAAAAASGQITASVFSLQLHL